MPLLFWGCFLGAGWGSPCCSLCRCLWGSHCAPLSRVQPQCLWDPFGQGEMLFGPPSPPRLQLSKRSSPSPSSHTLASTHCCQGVSRLTLIWGCLTSPWEPQTGYSIMIWPPQFQAEGITPRQGLHLCMHLLWLEGSGRARQGLILPMEQPHLSGRGG